MAWAHKSALWPTFGTSKTAGTSFGVQAPDAAAIGDFVLAIIGKDNTSTGADGDNGEVSSVTDNKGNTYTKLKEFSNTNAAAAGGATISVWGSVLTASLTNTDTVTFNFASCTAKAAIIDCFTIGAGSSVSVAGSATLANDAADPGSMTISSLPSQEYLFVRAVANEGIGTTYTPGTNYTLLTEANTTGGGAASNMGVAAGRRIFTGTGDTNDPTWEASDNASVYVALKEASSGAHTLTASSATYSITGTAAALRIAHVLPATTASYTITGSAATLSKGRPLTAAAGSYAITGAAAAFPRARVLAAATRAYVITGNSVAFLLTRRLAAATGSYAISGTAALMEAGRKLVAGAGSYVLTGANAVLTYTANLWQPISPTSASWSATAEGSDTWTPIPPTTGNWS